LPILPWVYYLTFLPLGFCAGHAGHVPLLLRIKTMCRAVLKKLHTPLSKLIFALHTLHRLHKTLNKRLNPIHATATIGLSLSLCAGLGYQAQSRACCSPIKGCTTLLGVPWCYTPIISRGMVAIVSCFGVLCRVCRVCSAISEIKSAVSWRLKNNTHHFSTRILPYMVCIPRTKP
jgi:hypothetical protein